jgi:hypothetical protein
MDEVEALFPIPLLRCHQLLGRATVEALIAEIRKAEIEQNLRSDQLFHARVASRLPADI